MNHDSCVLSKSSFFTPIKFLIGMYSLLIFTVIIDMIGYRITILLFFSVCHLCFAFLFLLSFPLLYY